MKKPRLLAAVCFLVSISGAYAQVSYGLKAGVNLANLTISGDIEDVLEPSLMAGFHAGAFVNFDVAENFSVQPELWYSSQGAEYEYEDEEEFGSGKLKVGYLNLPVMAQYQVVEGLYVEAGPQIGLLLSAKDEFEGDEEDIKDDVKDLDFGLGFGAVYKFPIGLGINARYNLGLADIYDGSEFDASIKNSVFLIGLSYSF